MQALKRWLKKNENSLHQRKTDRAHADPIQFNQMFQWFHRPNEKSFAFGSFRSSIVKHAAGQLLGGRKIHRRPNTHTCQIRIIWIIIWNDRLRAIYKRAGSIFVSTVHRVITKMIEFCGNYGLF